MTFATGQADKLITYDYTRFQDWKFFIFLNFILRILTILAMHEYFPWPESGESILQDKTSPKIINFIKCIFYLAIFSCKLTLPAKMPLFG